MRMRKTISVLGIAALLTGSVAPVSAQAAPEAPAAAARMAFAAPDTALGDGWRTSSDTAVTGVGDIDGFHLYVARESQAFTWSPLATLRSEGSELGAWTGEVCVTGSGRYAVAVYAPVIATNRPAIMMAGAFASVVDLATGAARHVVTGVQLAYFNPACGPSDRVLLTRALGADGEKTDLLAVNAATAKVESTRRIDAQFTTPAPAPDGDYGIAGGKLVKVGASGTLNTVATPAGQVFAVAAAPVGAVDLVSVKGDRAVAQRWQGGRLVETGTGPWDRLQLFRGPGGNRLVGDVTRVKTGLPELDTLTASRQVRAVSAQGHLVVERAAPKPDAIELTTRAAHSGKEITGAIAAGGGPTLTVPLPGGPAPKADPVTTLAEPTRTCAIPRNDPAIQPLQPSHNMVEWAVDQAVHDRLRITRPANYLKTGLDAYQPQVSFPLEELAYGDSVPAQLMLAILAQETNLAQASWHGVPGDSANPLISDYYGNRPSGGSNEVIDYSKSDCGYGIGQVTTGMRATDTVFSRPNQIKLTVDYAANIAASLNILIQKWNQLNLDSGGRMMLNDGDPRYIENWFLAVWAYNSGFYPYANRESTGGNWGVGWFNNPANPSYPANRHRFLEDTADAAIPSQWSYPEKIMGWAETPQWSWNREGQSFTKYAEPIFGTSSPGQLTLPDRFQFCSAVNNCLPTAPCSLNDNRCWWRGTTTFASCATQCGTEFIRFVLGSAEPAVIRTYERDCGDFTGDRISNKILPPMVVYTLNNTGQYNLGCSIGPSAGKFTLRLGHPAGGLTSPVETEWRTAEIDLHQLGAGHKGHMWFTHVYPPTWTSEFNKKHQVVATWTPNISFALGNSVRYDILVHTPSHGGEWNTSKYYVYPDPLNDSDVRTCTIDQSTDGADRWRYLDNAVLKRGARVLLKNVDPNGQGNVDIAFDAIAFVPISGAGHLCGQVY
jgi:hypothetical protein